MFIATVVFKNTASLFIINRQHNQIAGTSCYVFNTNLFWKQFKGLS